MTYSQEDREWALYVLSEVGVASAAIYRWRLDLCEKGVLAIMGENGVVRSMSRKGHSPDDAAMWGAQ